MKHDLLEIPGVGKRLKEGLENLGYHYVEDLNAQDPDAMYKQLCEKKQEQVDRCVLYVYRLAVYYATESVHDPELLKWWNWKEK